MRAEDLDAVLRIQADSFAALTDLAGGQVGPLRIEVVEVAVDVVEPHRAPLAERPADATGVFERVR